MTAAAHSSAADSFLGRMARSSRVRVREARGRETGGALLRRALATPPPARLELEEFSLFAELKYRSPAAGPLTQREFDGDGQIRAYAAGGAAAVSILTEPEAFHGSMEDLRRAAAVLAEHGIPAMRKDFLTDPYQVLEARAAGAGGVLVIVTMLDDGEVAALLQCAAECGLFVLLEGFDADDLERMKPFGSPPGSPAPVLCGVNCRDLRNLQVDTDRFRQLAAHLPSHSPVVAESGIHGPAEVAAVARLGYGAALVGSALMRSADPAHELAALSAAGAAGVRARRCS